MPPSPVLLSYWGATLPLRCVTYFRSARREITQTLHPVRCVGAMAPNALKDGSVREMPMRAIKRQTPPSSTEAAWGRGSRTRGEARVRPLNNYQHPKVPSSYGVPPFNSSTCRPSFRPRFQQLPPPPFVGVPSRTEQCSRKHPRAPSICGLALESIFLERDLSSMPREGGTHDTPYAWPHRATDMRTVRNRTLRSGRSNCSCGASKSAIHRYNVLHV